MRAFSMPCAVGILFALANQSTAQPIVTTPVAQTDKTDIGQDIRVPARPSVIVSTITLAPGARIPVHKHPYPRYVYVLQGVLTVVDLKSKKVFRVGEGGFLVEMLDRWHFGENSGKTSVRLVSIDQVPKGVTSNTIVQPSR